MFSIEIAQHSRLPVDAIRFIQKELCIDILFIHDEYSNLFSFVYAADTCCDCLVKFKRSSQWVLYFMPLSCARSIHSLSQQRISELCYECSHCVTKQIEKTIQKLDNLSLGRVWMTARFIMSEQKDKSYDGPWVKCSTESITTASEHHLKWIIGKQPCIVQC